MTARCDFTEPDTPYAVSIIENDLVTVDSVKGQLLVATPRLREATFARTVIAMLEHDATAGAVGVVLNRPLDVGIAEVVPAVSDLVTGPAVLFAGGPVSPSTAIALGISQPGADNEGWSVVAPSLVTVDLDHDAALLAAALGALRVFAGYAGWAAGQLEDEIAEGAWYVVDRLPLDPFLPDPAVLWSAVLRRQGWPLSAVAVCPVDPTLN
jgi:putative transcriptional regulator